LPNIIRKQFQFTQIPQSRTYQKNRK